MNASDKAHELSSKLFDLCYELSNLSLAAYDVTDYETAAEFANAVVAVKSAQAKLSKCELVIESLRV
jgi:hypothetical protein